MSLDSAKINLIRQLRKETLSAITDCKKALEATNYNLDKAKIHLREKGLIQKAKTSSQTKNNGRVDVFYNSQRAVLLSLRCETDFVARNQQFQMVFQTIGKLILKSKVTSATKISDIVDSNGENFNTKIKLLSNLLGEEIKIGLVKIISVENSEQFFASYTHSNAKIATLLMFTGTKEKKEIADQIALHTAATHPLYISIDTIPPEDLMTAKNKIIAEVNKKFTNKPEALKARIIENKLKSFQQETTLLSQNFVQDETKKISSILNSSNLKINVMIYETIVD